MIKNVLFLDRDGVINADSPDYIKSWEEFRFLPGSINAISRLTAAGHPIIIITNQSIIGRKMVPPEELDRIFSNMRRAVEAGGGRIMDIFFCPHLPEDGCGCRKPEPGLVQKAVEKYGIDLSTAGFIGDNAKDILCARAAGCAFSVLVESGIRSQAARQTLHDMGVVPDLVARDLPDAAEWIIANRSPGGPTSS